MAFLGAITSRQTTGGAFTRPKMTDSRIQGGIKIGPPEKLCTAFFGYQMTIRGNRRKLLSTVGSEHLISRSLI